MNFFKRTKDGTVIISYPTPHRDKFIVSTKYGIMEVWATKASNAIRFAEREQRRRDGKA